MPVERKWQELDNSVSEEGSETSPAAGVPEDRKTRVTQVCLSIEDWILHGEQKAALDIE